MHAHDRHGAKQPERFDPAKAGVLEDPARLEYLPVADVEALLELPHGGVLVDFGDDALGLLAAMLAPGGRALFIDWNADVERPVGPPRAHVLNPAEAKARLKGFGWKVLSERAFRYQYALAASRG